MECWARHQAIIKQLVDVRGLPGVIILDEGERGPPSITELEVHIDNLSILRKHVFQLFFPHVGRQVSNINSTISVTHIQA